MRKKKLATFILIVIIIILSTIYLIFQFETQMFLSKQGFVEMKVDNVISDTNPAVVLKGRCSELNILISPEQAFAIEQGLSKVSIYRPGTHDTLVSIIENFNIKPILVKITKLQDNTYFAELALQRWNNFLILDIRPSDALAIAVRTNTPIYVNENLITKTC